MSKPAFIFPGQGSQHIGMGQDVHTEYPLARERFDQASAILGYDLATLCFNGPEEQLNTTSYTQPAIYVHSYIMCELLAEKGVQPAMTAGHSLGEITALAAAGALDFDTGLKIVQQRGTLMQNASDYEPGTMAAIIGLDDAIVESVCKQAATAGTVGVANFNSPGQVVISGSIAGVNRAMELAKEQGAKRAIELKVSGAFHSPLMEPALKDFKALLENTRFNPLKVPVYSNVTGKMISDVSEVVTLLGMQLSNPVLWVQTILSMVADGATKFYEVGPGSVLTGLNKRIDRSLDTSAINNLESIQTEKDS